jgi:AcrR family transcriptional regulator
VTVATERGRRLEYAESTRQALVDSAVELISARGYAGTSLDAVAKRARVTKGALYHHFSGKQALFEAAFDQVETSVRERLAAIVESGSAEPPGDPWGRAIDGLREFVTICLEPGYQRIVLQEAPAVMGWERWREAEDQFSYSVVRTAVASLLDAGLIAVGPIEVTARLLFGAVSSGAMLIADATDQRTASKQVSEVVEQILTAMRGAADPRRTE